MAEAKDTRLQRNLDEQELVKRLRAAKMRPTRQRLALARLLFSGRHRHVTAENLITEAEAANESISVATVYNTLNKLTQAGLLRAVVVDANRTYYDTNTDHHYHFFHEDRGELQDIPESDVSLARLPEPPEGYDLSRVDVIVRLDPKPKPPKSADKT